MQRTAVRRHKKIAGTGDKDTQRSDIIALYICAEGASASEVRILNQLFRVLNTRRGLLGDHGGLVKPLDGTEGQKGSYIAVCSLDISYRRNSAETN